MTEASLHPALRERVLADAVMPDSEADRVLLAHMRDCLEWIHEYTGVERSRFEGSRLVQDAVIRNLQTLAESSQRLSSEINATEPQIPWRELAGFCNVIVHGYLVVDLGPPGWSSNKTCLRWPRPSTAWPRVWSRQTEPIACLLAGWADIMWSST